MAPFPRLAYPLETHALANAAEEERCLAEVDRLMAEGKARGRDVAALVVEPVQAEGGDNHASHGFFLALRRLCTWHGASFIVDEVTDGRPTRTPSLTRTQALALSLALTLTLALT